MTGAKTMAHAGKQAIDAADLQSEDIDLILTCPVLPDAVTPPAAAVVQYLIGGGCAAWPPTRWSA